ncbi:MULTISPECIES: hypothetical protein [unclassified Caballeronia]|uniref:hypothetical protein n=1 Tax=unclassified Caballeronia TaxID=2646786 RepID=UPI002858AF70|nr:MULTISPECIES: hypothetical protein [unclassified Caballeronia]MDR5777276.1 hypothetical protein [Caballeronia sp. LZ002]MDR5852714.1 hypothetical protein [Caballeronia sp. LZ003]
MIETAFALLSFPKAATPLGFPFKDDPPKPFHSDKSLLLCTSRADMSTEYGYTWPSLGETAEAPIWEPNLRFGGLRGWLYGHGEYALGGCLEPTAKWLVVEADTSDIIKFDGICKFPRGKVLFIGPRKKAAEYLITHEPRARELPVIGEHRTVGDGKSAIVGAPGTASAGDDGTAVAGNRGVALVGARGVATTGFLGTSVAGHCGTAVAGDGGVATVDDHGTAITGFQGKASAGKLGQISIWYWDFMERRYLMKVGYIGEDGLDPYTIYTLSDDNRFIKV